LNRADQISLIDISPEDLLKRLQEGKVYIPDHAARAIQNFFRRENLVALRELSLRKTADRVHHDVQTARFAADAQSPWLTSERLLVCVGPSPTSATVIRAAKRQADMLKAPWIAVHVETPHSSNMNPSDRRRLVANLQLAERLGAETITLSGTDIVTETLEYARTRNVTRIVLGKTDRNIGSRFKKSGLVDRLIENSGNIDVYLIRGAAEDFNIEQPSGTSRIEVWKWVTNLAALATATAICWIFHEIGLTEANLVMTYLLAVIFVAARCGPIQSVVASMAAVLLFDVFFTEPYFSVTVNDTQYIVTFIVMLAVGLLTSTLMGRVRSQAEVSRWSERRMESLYRLSRQLSGSIKIRDLIEVVEGTASEVFGGECVLFLPDEQGRIEPVLTRRSEFATLPTEVAAAQWVFDHNQHAGAATSTLPNAKALYCPVAISDRVLGVLAISHPDSTSLAIPETRQRIETYSSQVALTLERNRLVEESHRQAVAVESEKLRSSLLSSISHDLRTPLAAIAGSAETLLGKGHSLGDETRNELLESIFEESQRLNRMVENILHMTRLESGAVDVDKQWHPIEDVVGSALRRLSTLLEDRSVETSIPEDPLFGFFDAALLEQALVNLIENAVKYSPPGSRIAISGHRSDGNTHDRKETVLTVADDGPGILEGEEESIFERFYRPRLVRAERRGSGLGLAICRAIVEVHGGSIRAKNRKEGGAIFTVRLPFEGTPPVAHSPVDEEVAPA
jgi:two-component system sensor histidine kinase KdpD